MGIYCKSLYSDLPSPEQVSESTTAVQYCNEQTPALAVQVHTEERIDKVANTRIARTHHSHFDSTSSLCSRRLYHFLGEYNNNSTTVNEINKVEDKTTSNDS